MPNEIFGQCMAECIITKHTSSGCLLAYCNTVVSIKSIACTAIVDETSLDIVAVELVIVEGKSFE